MLIRLALTILALVAAVTPALPAKLLGPLVTGTALDCRLRPHDNLADIVIFNRTEADVPANTYIEVKSSLGGTVTVVAPQGIGVRGRLNVANARINGETCTARTIVVLAP